MERLVRENQRLLDQRQAGNGNDGEKGRNNAGGPDEKKPGREENPPRPKPPLKERTGVWVRTHPLGVLLIVVGLLLLGVAVIILWNYLQIYLSTADARIDGHIHQISSRIPGRVTHVYVEDHFPLLLLSDFVFGSCV